MNLTSLSDEETLEMNFFYINEVIIFHLSRNISPLEISLSFLDIIFLITVYKVLYIR